MCENEIKLCDYTGILEDVHLFDGISADRYEKLIAMLDGYERDYAKGDIIWPQGSRQDYIGIVHKGAVQGANVDITGDNQRIVERFYAGNIFGEAVAFGDSVSWVEVSAVENSSILFVSAKKIVENREDKDIISMGMNVLKEMAQKFVMVNMKNKLLAEPRLRNRILMYLKSIKTNEDGTVTVPYKQKELAQYLNVNKTSFNRELARMKEEGIIDIEGHDIRLLIDVEKMLMQ